MALIAQMIPATAVPHRTVNPKHQGALSARELPQAAKLDHAPSSFNCYAVGVHVVAMAAATGARQKRRCNAKMFTVDFRSARPATRVALKASGRFDPAGFATNIASKDKTVSDSFEVRSIVDKGLGVIATRDIEEGELLVAEPPLLTFKDDGSWGGAVQRQYIALPEEQQKALYDLTDVHTGEATDDYSKKTVQGIVSTNSVGARNLDFDGVVCDIVSRFNHSCEPNCEQYWDDAAMQEKVFASRAIKAGEELSYSYMEPWMPREERMGKLRVGYKFECSCPACTGADPASDTRRARLQAIMGSISSGVTSDVEGEVATAEEMLEICDRESLSMQGFRAQACYHAFQCCLLANRVEDAQTWIDKAVYHLENCRGKENAETQLLRGYADNPETHPAWEDKPGSALTTPLAIGAVAVAVVGAGYYFTQVK